LNGAVDLERDDDEMGKTTEIKELKVNFEPEETKK
jgi:hypothetical protein